MSEEMQLELEHTLKTMRELKEAKAEIERLRAALEELVGAVADPTSQKSIPLALRSARAVLAEEKPHDR